ncbi:SPT3 Dosage dependent suppressor of Ty-induced promoter mutations-like protein [Stygiomarasmius scandens]|uniref:SPT3 Dosage dependent suppressor of Ty-induced promoter mutations-like protein n=1 Tax=Marasmiellus scandens TaxID=2682957 RepID=A0ABR1K4V9_9AGAR
MSNEDLVLGLEEVLEQHAYEEDAKPTQPTNITLSSSIKPVPPPAPLPRKLEPALRSVKVVYPPKESCYNLPIICPSIPETGTKSRVETQIRLTVDLADPSSCPDIYSYTRVGSWKWLKLPQGTSTKRRSRKQGRIEPDPEDTLHLTVSVSCATPPHSRVLSCSSCQAREESFISLAKRVAKKIAARIRPAPSDSDNPDDPNAPPKKPNHEDTTSIVQFNCSEVIDFSTGSAVLPMRITCYCRHHREKVGFNVNLAMLDHNGRLVGIGSSNPIMITDDHKTTNNAKHELTPVLDYNWSRVTQLPELSPVEVRAPSKRKKDPSSTGKKRVRPYDASAKPNRATASRETSVSSASSPSTSLAALPVSPAVPKLPLALEPSSEPPPLNYLSQESESSPDGLVTPVDMGIDARMLPDESDLDLFSSNSPLVPPPSIPFLFDAPTSSQIPQLPTIHRLIPNCGPTHGGIEVTILGANFHPSFNLTCIFGDVAATSTQRWSDNTLVCILPPRASPGVVAVWFQGFPPKAEDSMNGNMNTGNSLFTYSDESDRALMELALQVVGLKMTGKIEDAKNVAMRIVGGGEGGGNGGNGDGGSGGMDQMQMHLSSRDLRPLLLIRAGESDDFESLIVNFLSLIDTASSLDTPAAQIVPVSLALLYQTKSGQTLLHLATMLGYANILKFLIKRNIDLDVRDRNGCTALHFAAMTGGKETLKLLLQAGADREIVDANGETPEEVAKRFGKDEDLADIWEYEAEDDLIKSASSDEEAEWGDGEEEAEELVRKKTRKSRRSRKANDGTLSRKRSQEDLSKAADKTSQEKVDEKVDEKHALSLMDLFQRTVAQLPGAPYIPLLPGMPAVPWDALPQIPMVFPVAVPLLPGWFGQGKEHEEVAPTDGGKADTMAQEWRTLWEKWLAQATEMVAPPKYTPRAPTAVDSQEAGPQPRPELVQQHAEEEQEQIRPSSTTGRRAYNDYSTSVPQQEMDAYAYQPKTKQKKRE